MADREVFLSSNASHILTCLQKHPYETQMSALPYERLSGYAAFDQFLRRRGQPSRAATHVSDRRHRHPLFQHLFAHVDGNLYQESV